MPYDRVEELPPNLKKYSDKIQRQWMYVFNGVLKSSGDEEKAFQSANSVLKGRFKRTNWLEKNSHQDKFNMLVDSFLKNL